MSLLSVKNLKTYFYTYEGIVKAIDGINLEIGYGRTVGLVGESGSGKSVTALSILRLIPPSGFIVDGEILYKGNNILRLDEEDMRKIRGGEISMIFQEPRSSLNPVLTAGEQISEMLLYHDEEIRSYHDKRSRERMVIDRTYKILEDMGVSEPERVFKSYPHELSGGLCQRVMIAMAMICNPSILIADEPTTSLDVTTQAQILDIMRDLVQKFGSSVLMITHNLGIVAGLCDDVAVMYAGRIIESGDVMRIFEEPCHPYTIGLMNAIPYIDKDAGKRRLETIPGSVPNPINLPRGCRFHPRCAHTMDICKKEMPPCTKISKEHSVACWIYHQDR